MTSTRARGSREGRPGSLQNVARVRLAGLPVRADASFAVIVVLVAASFWLRFALRFPQAAAAGLAAAATALFFGSVLVHELAHASEARRRGLQVVDIRLHVFGGATRITSDIGRARDELALALAGPWASIVLACAFGLGAWAADRAGLAAASALAGVLAWLNALLGVFNLLPAAPLDGGRVLDAVVWWATGNRATAARVATGSGLALGVLLALLGALVAVAVGAGIVMGLWLVLLGWFLFRTAGDERRGFELRRRLEGHRAGELAVPRASVPLGAPVEEALGAAEAAGEREAILVAGPAGIVGVLLVATMARLAPSERWFLRAGQVMTPVAALPSVDAAAPAVEVLAAAGEEPVVVRQHGEVRAVVTEAQLDASLARLISSEAPPGPPAVAGPAPAPPRTAPGTPSRPPGSWQGRLARLGLLAASGAVVVAGASLVPMPLVEVSPGPAIDVPSLVVTDAPVHPVRGELLLTSVRLAAPSALGTARAVFAGDRELLWRSSVLPAGIDPADYAASQRQVFRDSVQLASAVAFRAAGYGVRIEGGGAVVRAVEAGGPADGALAPGDVVTAAAGEPVASAADLVAQISRVPVGRSVVLDVRRGDRRLRVELQPVSADALGRPVLGIAVEDASPLVQLPFSVRVARSDLGGPSAGLMTALSVYALVSGTDVTGGRVVAGTGTIDAEGAVGAVGGIAEKVRGAARAGASVFLVPAPDATAARRAAGPGLRVVPVDSFDRALGALRSLPAVPR